MKDKLLKIARYLGQNGFYKEAAAVNALRWEGGDPVDRETLTDVIPSDPPKSPELRLIELLHAAALVRRKYKGKSAEEVLESLGFSHDSKDYEQIKMELENLMKNPFYG